MENVNQIKIIMNLNFVKRQMENVMNVYMVILLEKTLNVHYQKIVLSQTWGNVKFVLINII